MCYVRNFVDLKRKNKRQKGNDPVGRTEFTKQQTKAVKKRMMCNKNHFEHKYTNNYLPAE